jgi:dATP pyrophosphohydrolase
LTTEGRLSDCDTVRTFEIDPRWRDRFPPGITHNREHEWRYRLPGRVDVVLDRKEHSRVEWCPIEEAISRVWSWTNREALQDLRDKL